MPIPVPVQDLVMGLSRSRQQTSSSVEPPGWLLPAAVAQLALLGRRQRSAPRGELQGLCRGGSRGLSCQVHGSSCSTPPVLLAFCQNMPNAAIAKDCLHPISAVCKALGTLFVLVVLMAEQHTGNISSPFHVLVLIPALGCGCE